MPTDDDRIMLWRHKVSGDLFEVRITDDYQTARPFRQSEGSISVPSGTYTEEDHRLGAEVAAHAEEYEEVPMREIYRSE